MTDFTLKYKNLLTKLLKMTDSFMHNHQSALDSFMEDKAIQDLENAGIYPEPSDKEISVDDDDYEPTDEEMMASFGTKWHDGL